MVNSAAGGTDSTSRRINKARRGSTVRWSRACARRTTSFPCPSALGTAFNDLLYFLIGQADGREGRAINNLRNHVTQNQYGDGMTTGPLRSTCCAIPAGGATRRWGGFGGSETLDVGRIQTICRVEEMSRNGGGSSCEIGVAEVCLMSVPSLCKQIITTNTLL